MESGHGDSGDSSGLIFEPVAFAEAATVVVVGILELGVMAIRWEDSRESRISEIMVVFDAIASGKVSPESVGDRG